jgi:hypothetical protein
MTSAANILRLLLPSTYTNKKFLTVTSILIVSLLVDTSLTRIYCISTCSGIPVERLPVFIAITVVYAISQYLILGFIKQKSREIRAKQGLPFKAIHNIVTIGQTVLTVILVFIILQTVIASYYNTVLLISANTISYMLAIIMMGLLAYRFFSWFESNRNAVVFSYGLSSVMIVINALLTLAFVNNSLLTRPPLVREFLITVVPFFPQNSYMSIINHAYIISDILSFLLMWGSTSLLLRHYSKRLGSFKYWIIVSIPLVYFLSQFLNLFASLLSLDPVFYGTLLTLSFAFSKPAGGILFGIAFWTMAKSIGQSRIRDYLIISGVGLVLLFVSNQAIVLANVPYPPFGVATVSIMGLSSYLILIGIYYSAISVAEDSKLRQSIRKTALRESKLLDSIGTSQMEQEIQRRVVAMTKANQDILENETGVEPSLSESEVKEYLQEVLKEVKKGKVQNGDK